jgi:hypothetical protein
VVGRLYSNVGSERGQNGKFYMMIALNTIVGIDDHDERARYYWLAPDGAILALLGATLPGASEGYRANVRRVGNPTNVPGAGLRETLLTELGRVMVACDKETMLRCARQLCEMEPKPSTREAVAMVRRWRLGEAEKPKPPGLVAYELAQAVGKFVEQYAHTHSGVTDAVLMDAFEYMHMLVCEDVDGEKAGDGHD